EHREGATDERVLHRVQADPGERLGERECGEGEEHEEERVLGGAIREGVDVDGIEERRARDARRREEVSLARRLVPYRLAAGREVAHAPGGFEAVGRDAPL